MAPELEAALWVLSSLAARPLAAMAWARLRSRAGEWREALELAAPWAHAIVPLYVSLLTGAVLGSWLGIYGFGLQGSLLAGAIGAVILATLFGVRWFGSNRIRLPEPPVLETAIRDELRWAFYRGAAAGWLGQVWMGGLAGLGLAAVEWIATVKPWTSSSWKEPDQWAAMVRAGFSAVLYGLSGNLWIILVVQLLAVVIWRLKRPESEPETGGLE